MSNFFQTGMKFILCNRSDCGDGRDSEEGAVDPNLNFIIFFTVISF